MLLIQNFIKIHPYKYSRTGQKQAKNAGFKTRFIPNVYDFEYMQEEAKGHVPKSALNGEVIYGNNNGKNSLDKTYLQRAVASGRVQIMSQHQVKKIKQTAQGSYLLKTEVLDEMGNTIQFKEFRCDSLFLGAGSIGTTSLLIEAKARGDLKALPETLGKFWGNNGNVMAGRNFIKQGVGRLQSTIPVISIDNRHDPSNYFLSEIAPLPMNMETWTTLYLLITRAQNNGEIFYNSQKQAADLQWNLSNNEQLRAIAKKFVRKMNKTNGGTRAHLLFNNGIAENICYHPLGGCVLGKATDSIGRVLGQKGLYVVDSSLIPGGIGANPFLTITALAEYCMDHIIKNDFKT